MSGKPTATVEDVSGGHGRPELSVKRLLLVGTGSVSVSELPFWLGWLNVSYPELDVRVAITRSAERFVTRSSLAARSNNDVFLDAWADEGVAEASHVELADWAEAVVVYPATLSFVSRLALGAADSPVLLACQCTQAPVVLAPALPPGGVDSAAYKKHRAELEARPNTAIVSPRAGMSLVERKRTGAVPPPLLNVLQLTDTLYRDIGPGRAKSSLLEEIDDTMRDWILV